MSCHCETGRPDVPARVLRLEAPAKVNLYLGVYQERDERGYHRVDSVMHAVGLVDKVEIAPADELSLVCEPAVDCPVESNCAWRAAVLMGEAFGREPRVSIHIAKGIPSQSGLGGASADAAAVIVGLCELWGVDTRREAVVDVARRVGADVPFFLGEGPELLEGAGDVLAGRFTSLDGVPVVLVRPRGAGVVTGEAYAEFDLDPVPAADRGGVLGALRAGDVRALARALSNNLAPAAQRLIPEASRVLEALSGSDGVLRAMVTGSGSCCFALCSSAEAARAAARAARSRGWWSCATSLRAAGVRLVEKVL